MLRARDPRRGFKTDFWTLVASWRRNASPFQQPGVFDLVLDTQLCKLLLVNPTQRHCDLNGFEAFEEKPMTNKQ